MNMDVHFSSADQTWETPQAFFDKLDREFHFSGSAIPVDGGGVRRGA